MPQKKPAKKPHLLYSADRPIGRAKEDILGRSKFADQLLRDLQAWDGNDSMVVALQGPWGAGKTSLVNLVLEANEKSKTRRLPVVQFNPWQLSGTGNIAGRFFNELRIALKSEGPLRDRVKRAKSLKVYAAALNVTSSAISIFGKVAQVMSGLPVAPAAGSAATALKELGGTAKDAAELLQAEEAADEKGLDQHKRELAALLSRLSRPILVVIDDIDRLTTAEILQIFQLVKANADFPKITYLLLFDREIVGTALDQISGGRGVEFLEKIVQAPYHVPTASRGAIERLLFHGLDGHIDGKPAERNFDKNRWHEIYLEGLQHYFGNLRHVYRFLSSFDFHARHHGDSVSFEVNPVDLIALEVLRVFEPGVYERLPSAKAELTRHGVRFQINERSQETIEAAVEQIVKAARPGNEGRVRAIIRGLFPQTSKNYQKGLTPAWSDWLRDQRVCHHELFDKYFTLTIANDDISQRELDALIAARGDVAKFTALCESLQSRRLLKLALQRMEPHKRSTPESDIGALAEAFFSMSDSWPDEGPAFFDAPVDSLALRQILFGLQAIPDFGRRAAILKSAISKSSSISLPVSVVHSATRLAEKKELGDVLFVSVSELSDLKEVCVAKIRDASASDAFLNLPSLCNILWRWHEWGTPREVKSWAAKHVRTLAEAATFLSAMMNRVTSSGKPSIRYYIDLKNVESFLDEQDLRRIVDSATAATRAELSEVQRTALKEFARALQRRAEGKTANPGLLEDSDE